MKSNRGFTIVEVVIVVVVAILIGGWVYSWQRAQQGASQETSATTPTTSATVSASEVASSSASPAPTADPYVGWKTYTQANGYYSFKYPADWNVSSQPNGDLDKVTVSKKGETLIQFYRFVNAVGCGDPNPKSRQALVGSTTVTLLSECDGPYFATMWIESQPHLNSSDVRVTAAFGKGEDTNIALILGSINGLIPMASQ